MKFVTAAVLMAGWVWSASAATPVVWGSEVNGMRVGISFDKSSDVSGLRVFLQNTGDSAMNVALGKQVGAGVAVNLKFFAAASDGKEREGFEKNSFTPVEGLITPFVVRLNPGDIHEERFPLTSIFCVDKPGAATFAGLVKQGYTVRVSLAVDDKSAVSGTLTAPK